LQNSKETAKIVVREKWLLTHSGSTIAVFGTATAQWLFHQEKATLQDVGKGT
jgi:hypothetical protein